MANKKYRERYKEYVKIAERAEKKVCIKETD